MARVVFDEGIVSETVQLIDEQRLWPDPARKKKQARKSLDIAHAIVASGDHDAPLEQLRTAPTLTAHWRLLEDRRFPLSRAELPTQLEGLGYMTLATDLATTIHDAPGLDQLALDVDSAYELLNAAPIRMEQTTRSHAA